MEIDSIVEAQKKKSELEGMIISELLKFERETGMRICDIDYTRTKNYLEHPDLMSMIDGVQVKVEL